MLSLKKLLFFGCAVIIPCLSFADHFHRNKADDFNLCEFAGNYISYSNSAGSVGVIIDPNAAALSSVAQFRLNCDGTGTANFLNFTNFMATFEHRTVTLTDLPIQFFLTNASQGVGSLTIFDFPTVGSQLNTMFVASKGPKNRSGKHFVNEMFLNINSMSGVNSVLRSTAAIVAKRQSS